jgi:hypothetical protein
MGPAASTARRGCCGIGHVERQHAQAAERRQQVFARRAHGGDDAPAAFEEMARGFEAEAGRAAGDEDGFHGCFWGLVG